MNQINQDILLFFHTCPAAFPLYQAFEDRLLDRFPDTRIRVQKNQISFYNRHLYACVSLRQVRKKAELPSPFIVVTLGLPYPLPSDRVAARTEPYPGRWTNHIVISRQEEMDDTFFSWMEQAYYFAQNK